MEIVEIKVLRGPNYWSNYRSQLIQMKLDLGDFENLPTDKIPGFAERIERLMPSMISHRCSEGEEGGFFSRIQTGTWLGHVAEHIALELQTLAGLECGYGRTRSVGVRGIYHVVFAYEIEEAGIYAAKAAARIVEALATNVDYDLSEDIAHLKGIKVLKGLHPLLQKIVDHARERNIPWNRDDDGSGIKLGHGINQKQIVLKDSEGSTTLLVDSIASNARTEFVIKADFAIDNLLNQLYDEEGDGRIPLIAVTGTNGKTTVTRLFAHIASAAGYITGYTSTDGIFINHKKVQEGDCSGPASAKTVLNDATVTFAVLESARGGILRAGLGFDQCSVSIVTNVTEDHLGLGDIETLEDLAKVKIVVPRSTLPRGFAILNADDKLVRAMSKELDCQVGLFSLSASNEHVARHCKHGGLAAIVRNGRFVILKGSDELDIAEVESVPLTMHGRAECMISNALAVILGAYSQGIRPEIISRSILNFFPSAEQSPGRMNIFNFNHCQVMLDYAHNTAGFEMMKIFMSKTEASHKIGIISCAGDRRDQDIILMGRYAAEMFDEIIIRHDKDGRGRSNESLTEQLENGINSVSPDFPRTVISDEIDALRYAMDHAPKNAFILVCSDDIHGTIDYLRNCENKRMSIAV